MLIILSFVKSPSEAILYVRGKGANFIIVSIYVDNLHVILRSDEKLTKELKVEMLKVFETTNLYLMSYFLEMEVKKNHNRIFIWKKKYAREILRKFHMKNYKSISTFMNQKEKFNKDIDGIDKVDYKGYYKRLIRCLMYLIATRVDITFTVSLLSWFMHRTSEIYLQVAKRVVKCIKTQWIMVSSEFYAHGYCDID